MIDLEQEPSDSKTPPQSTEIPKSTVLETEEQWQIPNEVPNLVKQITQAHRRLENLLTTLTSKAPPNWLRSMDYQFHKVQREAVLQEVSKTGENQSEAPRTQTINSLVLQIGRLEAKLADKEELIALYTESSFETQTQLAEKEDQINRLQTELQTITHKDQQELLKIQQLEDTHMQQMEAKRKEAIELQQQVQKLTEEAALQKGEKSKLKKNRTTPPTDTTSPLADQTAKLEARLANAEELIDIYVEHSFETQAQLAEKEKKWRTQRRKSRPTHISWRTGIRKLPLFRKKSTNCKLVGTPRIGK